MSSDQLEEKIKSITEKYIKMKELLDDHRKLGSEREVYEAKYEAINILKETETDLNNIINSGVEEERDKFITRLAIVHLNKGLLHVDTEELKVGEEQFMKCIDLLKGRELEPEVVPLVLSTYNQLGILWSRWSQPEKAKEFLDQAERIYKDFNDTKNSCKVPVSFASSFGIPDTEEDLNTKPLERIHTLTLYYLAQVYKALKNHHKSAVYCHMTLHRQLEENDITEDLDYIEWALNAATLSQYFMKTEGFSQARHHLAGASYILNKYETKIKERGETESEAVAAEYERFKHRSADVARCWAKYGILLLSSSKQRLLEKAEKDESDLQDTTESQLNPKSEKDPERSLDDLKFDILMDDIKPYADQITDTYLLDFNDARPVFLNIQKWLDEAKLYYTLEDHASDYVEIIQDMSEAYKHLAFFEENEDRQAKMHKRRIDILEATVKELNPQYYKTACRLIWMELGVAYSSILGIKLDRLRMDKDSSNPHASIKINHLAKNSIKYFQLFIDSLETNSSDGKVVTFSDDEEEAALGAYFQIGRLYNKIISPEKAVQIENTQNSINAYRFIIDYCEAHPKAAERMKEELYLSREFVRILPIKIINLKTSKLTVH